MIATDLIRTVAYIETANGEAELEVAGALDINNAALNVEVERGNLDGEDLPADFASTLTAAEWDQIATAIERAD